MINKIIKENNINGTFEVLINNQINTLNYEKIRPITFGDYLNDHYTCIYYLFNSNTCRL